ncbi:flavodoxin family protein [Clostridium manihotivorum]|uniref:Flavodoxin family protein n=1 Tax=Clostridium manihotivorum TaxID=2320868 RepID=A0A3R5QU82_9CLOT|nr:flavodoxin family protein [Clostridium manihotivorum]QAA32641.1 flavodoxin family protein [Clostridium manihotivorum]
MNILVITGSPRKNGNTEIIAGVFAESAREVGHKVTVRKLSENKVNPCIDCKYCFTHDGVCVQNDDMNEILKDLDKSDILVLASPIYWFDVSAQTKCFIDRMYAFAKKGFHLKSIAMLLNSGADGVYDAAEAQLKAMSAYLKWEIKGVIKIPNLQEKGSINDVKELEQVRDFAKSL